MIVHRETNCTAALCSRAQAQRVFRSSADHTPPVFTLISRMCPVSHDGGGRIILFKYKQARKRTRTQQQSGGIHSERGTTGRGENWERGGSRNREEKREHSSIETVNESERKHNSFEHRNTNKATETNINRGEGREEKIECYRVCETDVRGGGGGGGSSNTTISSGSTAAAGAGAGAGAGTGGVSSSSSSGSASGGGGGAS